MTLTTLIHSNLPRKCWGWASLLSCEVLNRTISRQRTKTRLEMWYGKELPHQANSLHPFGCLAFKHIPGELRSKLQEKAIPYVYLGVDPNSRTYLLGSLYDLVTTTAVDVTFVEGEFPFRNATPTSAASLLWGSNPPIQQGDLRSGQFDIPIADKGLYKSLISAFDGHLQSQSKQPDKQSEVKAPIEENLR